MERRVASIPGVRARPCVVCANLARRLLFPAAPTSAILCLRSYAFSELSCAAAGAELGWGLKQERNQGRMAHTQIRRNPLGSSHYDCGVLWGRGWHWRGARGCEGPHRDGAQGLPRWARDAVPIVEVADLQQSRARDRLFTGALAPKYQRRPPFRDARPTPFWSSELQGKASIPKGPTAIGRETGSAPYQRPLNSTPPPLHHQNSVGTCCVTCVAQ